MEKVYGYIVYVKPDAHTTLEITLLLFTES